jgi:hypothetical protein
LTSAVLLTANSVMAVNTMGGIAGAARVMISVIGPGASASSCHGTTETAVTATAI